MPRNHTTPAFLCLCIFCCCSFSCANKGAGAGAVNGDGASREAAPQPEGLIDGRTLAWSDEFDGSTLDTTAWNYELGDGCPNLCGWGNNERQLYTRDNHRLEDGHLIITARHTGDAYTSTRITTERNREFKYGYIEVRAQLPVGQGLWPAFWALGQNIRQVGWPTCGEIDIMEYVGRKPGEVFTTLHTKAGHGDNGSSKITPAPGIEEDFHRYAVDWTAEKMDFYIDDAPVFTFAPQDKSEAVWPFDQPVYLLINLAIGGNFGGPEVDDSVFPQEFVVDYVRVYRP